jgi:hypothetical protein
MADPFSLTVNVVQLISTTATTIKTIDHLIKQYRDAPAKLTSLSSESKLVKANLKQIQTMFATKSSLKIRLEREPELKQAVDNTLTGCWAVFILLEKELLKLVPKPGENPLWKQKASLLFNDEIIKDYRSQINGHIQGLNSVMSCLQAYVIRYLYFVLYADRI